MLDTVRTFVNLALNIKEGRIFHYGPTAVDAKYR